MALIEQALYSYLSGYAGLVALISTRLYPDTSPQEPDFPYMVFYKIDDAPEYTMGGETVLTDCLFQFDAVSKTGLESKQIGEQLRLALSGYSGAMGAGANQVTVDWTTLLGQHDQFEDNAGRRVPYVTRISEYAIAYRQTAATP